MGDRFKELIEKKSVKITLIILLIVLIVLVAVFGFAKKEDNNTDSVLFYVDNLENKLQKLLSKIDGAGKVSVIISVESGMETVLATKTTETNSVNGKEIVEEPILVNGKTVIIKELYPKIIGVVIVAEGANNIKVYRNIQQATVSLLDVSINQVEILTMK